MLSSGSQDKILVVMYLSSGTSILSGPSAAASSIATTAINKSRSVTKPTGFRSFSLSTTGTIPVSTRFMISAATWAVSDGIQQTGFRVITWLIRIIPSHSSTMNFDRRSTPQSPPIRLGKFRVQSLACSSFIIQIEEFPSPARLILSPLLSRPPLAGLPGRHQYSRDQPPEHQRDDRQEKQNERSEEDGIYYTHCECPDFPINRRPTTLPAISNATCAPVRKLCSRARP